MLRKQYWNLSFRKLKETKYIALVALFVALKVVLSVVRIPVAENLHIGITFLVIAIEASIIGPAAGMISGFITDILGFMVFPSGSFFFGYTLSAMLTELIYGLFLYQKRISILRLFVAKAVNNYLVNVLLGSLWSAMLYGNGYLYYASTSLIKNTIMLPIETAGLVILFNVLIPFLKSHSLHEADTTVPLPFH